MPSPPCTARYAITSWKYVIHSGGCVAFEHHQSAHGVEARISASRSTSHYQQWPQEEWKLQDIICICMDICAQHCPPCLVTRVSQAAKKTCSSAGYLQLEALIAGFQSALVRLQSSPVVEGGGRRRWGLAVRYPCGWGWGSGPAGRGGDSFGTGAAVRLRRWRSH